MSDEVLHCKWHPNRETMLRCARCDTPICYECAVRTPVGYICPDCAKLAKRRFDQATVRDIVVGGLLALVLGGVGAFLTSWIGWFVIFLAPPYGSFAANLIWWAVRRHHSERLWWIVLAAFLLPTVALGLMLLREGALYDLLWTGVYLALVLSSLGYVLRLK